MNPHSFSSYHKQTTVILLTDGIYPFVTGGMQKHSYYLAKYLARNKVNIELYHCIPIGAELVTELDGFTKEELQYINHYCFYFPKTDRLPGHYIRENKKLSEQYLEHYLSNPQILKSSNPQLIYAQGFSGSAFIKAKKQGAPLPPVIVNFHGLEMFQKAPSLRVKLEHLLLRKAVRYNIRNADHSISLGGKLTGISEEEKAKSIIETPIGIERSWLSETENKQQTQEPRKIVFIGRYERRKGIEELNDVLEELNKDKNTPGYEFHFIGPVPDKVKGNKVQSTRGKGQGKGNKAQGEENDTKHRIIYHGLIKDQEEIKAILKQCDILVSPSWSEGMPTVILEAMASGCAIIATDVGAVSEQVDSSNGWLINPGNKKELKQAIIEALSISDEELILKKQNSIKKIKEKFLWNDVIKLVLEKLL